MNLIAIDPSLICTAMVVNEKIFVYTTNNQYLTKSGKVTKWFEDVENKFLATVRVNDKESSPSFSRNEMNKFYHYVDIANDIVSDILENSNKNKKYLIYIEGYSYSSKMGGPLIDLVTFGSILRYKLLKELGNSATIHVLPPKEVKYLGAKLSYKENSKGKIINSSGVSAGSFKKDDIYKCLLDRRIKLNCPDWHNYLTDNKEVMLSKKSIVKPIEDINDAVNLYDVANEIIRTFHT